MMQSIMSTDLAFQILVWRLRSHCDLGGELRVTLRDAPCESTLLQPVLQRRTDRSVALHKSGREI